MKEATINQETVSDPIDWDAIKSAPRVNDAFKTDREIIITNVNNYRSDQHRGELAPPTLPLNTPNGTIIRDSFEHYLAAKEFFSTGSITKLALGDPLDFQWDIEEGIKAELEKFKDTSHFDLGRFLHLAVLEPEKWNEVVVEPKHSRSSNDGCNALIKFWEEEHFSRGIEFDRRETFKVIDERRMYIEYLKLNAGIPCISEENSLIISQLFKRWSSYEDAAWFNLLMWAHKEVSMYANNFNGLPMRVRPDGLLFDNQIGVNAIVSVKTTSSPTIRQFKNQAASLGYHLKESAYQDIVSHVTGMDFHNTIMIVFQTCEPFHVGVFHWNHDDVHAARHLFNDGMSEAKKLLKQGVYPGWEEMALPGCAGLIEMKMPEWVNNQIE